MSIVLARHVVVGSTQQWNWQCQTPGVAGLCATVCENECVEGPLGFPGGCGFCKFCAPELLMESPECVSVKGEGRSSGGLIQGQIGWIEDSDILVQDVNSWFETNGVQMLPRVMTALQCAKVCQDIDECNGWSFCWDPQGCGVVGQCAAIPPAKNGTDSCSDTMGVYSTCKADGKFGPMTCMLHSILGVDATINGSMQGWTSGIFQEDTRLPLPKDLGLNLTCTL